MVGEHIVVGRSRWLAVAVALALPFAFLDDASGFLDVAKAQDRAPRAAERKGRSPQKDSKARRSGRGKARPKAAVSKARKRGRSGVKRRKRGRQLGAAYRRMRSRWHRAAPQSAVRAWRKLDPPPLVLRPVGRSETYEITPGQDGQFDGEQLRKMAEAMAYKDTTETVSIHPRLANVLYRAVKKYGAPYVHVISGYRPTRATSRHAQGRAIDVVLPGVPDRRLAAFFRSQGFVGVGFYPVSGFVHLDVRDRSHFWVDRSLPGAPQRPRAWLKERALREDRKALRRGEERVPDADAVDGDPGNGGRLLDTPEVEPQETDEE
ncbi:MAG: DUF882 domain-containing protein [Myxococcales bacterium]|nr:DUF882 domain-containing protein [Myxococcales bacterium]